MTSYRQVPTFEQPMHVEVEGKHVNTSWWYRYFQAHDFGIPPGGETVVHPTGSPFKYTAPRKGTVIVSGGTVSNILLSRTGVFYVTGVSSGTFTVSQGDQLQIVYSALPTMVFFPS